VIGSFGNFGMRSGNGRVGRALLVCVLAALVCLVPVSAALAQEDGPAPQTGVDPRPKRGMFAETTLGLFTSVGGSQVLSNGQPYLGMTVGRDIGDLATVFVALGIGASSASCFDQPLAPTASNTCNGADSFGATYLEVGGSYGKELANRLRLSAKLVAGLTQLAPGPNKDPTVKPNPAVPDSVYGPHFGGGLGLDYDTRLDHFAVGFDVIARYSLTGATKLDGSSLSLLSIAFLPRIRYVF
jgi:hypothetical protein